MRRRAAVQGARRRGRGRGGARADPRRAHGLADEGGWWPELRSNEEAPDTLAEDAAEGFAAFTAAHGDRVQIIGDDLLVTRADAGQLKVGSFARAERTATWNTCMRIEEELGPGAIVRGRPVGRTWWGRTGRVRE